MSCKQRLTERRKAQGQGEKKKRGWPRERIWQPILSIIYHPWTVPQRSGCHGNMYTHARLGPPSGASSASGANALQTHVFHLRIPAAIVRSPGLATWACWSRMLQQWGDVDLGSRSFIYCVWSSATSAHRDIPGLTMLRGFSDVFRNVSLLHGIPHCSVFYHVCPFTMFVNFFKRGIRVIIHMKCVCQYHKLYCLLLKIFLVNFTIERSLGDFRSALVRWIDQVTQVSVVMWSLCLHYWQALKENALKSNMSADNDSKRKEIFASSCLPSCNQLPLLIWPRWHSFHAI